MKDNSDIATSLRAPTEEPEGQDLTGSSGWGEYPLDSVFVRPEQRTVGEVVKRILANRYDLNPEFQREFLWPIEKQSRLIESCLMRIPLPVFYVAEAPDGRIIVVDGLQRLSTFKRYLSNEFALRFPPTDDENARPNLLAGKYFRDLQLNLQERIEDTQLILYVLDAKAPERAKLDIFERVNSGVPLTRQQMRNCLYNGEATIWLKTAAMSDAFQRATGGTLDRSTMRDREAINRFCAFKLLGWRSYRSGDMDTFLAEALEEMNSASTNQLSDLWNQFSQAMNNNFELFGRHAFRKSLCFPQGQRSVINIALFDVCSTAFASFSLPDIKKFKDRISQTVQKLIAEPGFSHAITYSTNSTRQVAARFARMEVAVAEAID